MIVKCITVWQPWASLIAIGAKPYEFRTWRAPKSLIGKRIAIQAGARKPRKSEIKDLLTRLAGKGVTPCLHVEIAGPFLTEALEDPERLILSHVVCTATLGETKGGDECAKEFGSGFGNDSERLATFNWGWPLIDVAAIEPVPAKGSQGFFNVSLPA